MQRWLCVCVTRLGRVTRKVPVPQVIGSYQRGPWREATNVPVLVKGPS